MDSDALWAVILWIGGCAILLGATYALDRRHRKLRPECCPYGWGYFLGIGCLLATVLLALDAWRTKSIESFTGAAFLALLGAKTILRYRWALIVVTLLTVNPIVWIIGIFYLRNRWKELRREERGGLAWVLSFPRRSWLFALARLRELSRSVQGKTSPNR